MVKSDDINSINDSLNSLKSVVKVDASSVKGTDGNYTAEIYATKYSKKIGEINIVNDNEPNVRSYYLLDANGSNHNAAVIDHFELDQEPTNNIASSIKSFGTRLGY